MVIRIVDALIRLLAVVLLLPFVLLVALFGGFSLDHPDSTILKLILVYTIGLGLAWLVSWSARSPLSLAKRLPNGIPRPEFVARVPAYLFAVFGGYYLLPLSISILGGVVQ